MLTSPCTMCPSNYCVTFQELLLCKLQSICCQAQSWVCPPPPFYISTEEVLWGFGVAAVWFTSFQHQASNPSPYAPRGLLDGIIHILSTLPHTILFHMAGPASHSQVCVRWMGLAFAWLYPSCSTLNKRRPPLHTLGICSTPLPLLRLYTIQVCLSVYSDMYMWLSMRVCGGSWAQG